MSKFYKNTKKESQAELEKKHLKEMAAIAAKQLEQEEKRYRFDPTKRGSRPTPAQQEIIDTFVSYKYENIWCMGGNQSKPAYALILMADGSLKPISCVRVGDMVKTFDFKTQSYVAAPVSQIHNHGEREVSRFYFNDHNYIDMTADHEMVTVSNTTATRKLVKRKASECDLFLQYLDLRDYDLTEPARSKYSADFTELLGYLIGDGCFTKFDRGCVQFTNTNEAIIERVRSLISDEYEFKTYGSTDYYLVKRTEHRSAKENVYKTLLTELGLFGKYAHEKFIPAYIFSESDAVKLRFISGLIATDGWCDKSGIGFCTTSYALADGLHRLWQSLGVSSALGKGKPPKKDTHRQTYQVRVRHTMSVNHLRKYLHIPSKPIIAEKVGQGGNGVYRYNKFRNHESIGMMQVYDITVDHPDHNYICDGFLTGNSGKTQTCAYLIAHILMEDLPNWQRRPQWTAPLQIIWAVRNGKHVEGSLWRKCKPFIPVGSYKEDRQGGQLQRVVMDNGNELIFLIYTNINEATEAAQSYTANFVFIDELPSKAKLIEELQNRVLVNKGLLMAAFTPKKPAPEVRRIIENADARFNMVYRIKSLDNPSLDERAKQLQIAKAAQYGEMGAAILDGHWVDTNDGVFFLNEKKIVRQVPYYYNKLEWVHYLSEDPAFNSGFGLVVAAQDPITEDWYVVRATELKGASVECPSIAVDSVLNYTRDLNIVKRFADPAALGYIREARKMGVKHSGGVNKMAEDVWYGVDLIQEVIGRTVFITPDAQALLDELADYRTSPDDPTKIIHRKKYHMIDAFRYLVTQLPKRKKPEPTDAPQEEPVDPERFLKSIVFGQRDKDKKARQSTLTAKLRVRNSMFWGNGRK